MSTATLNGAGATSMRVTLPVWGVWWADVALGEESDLAVGARVELELAGLKLSGTIMSGGNGKGRAAFRIAGGAGGWWKKIPGKSYETDAGVKVSTVVQEAATAAGETLAGDLGTARIDAHFVRHEGPAELAMELVAPRGWYVDETGATRLGKRPTTTFTGEAARKPVDPVRGVLVLAPESAVGLVPGVVVDGLEATDVELAVGGGGGLRVTLYGRGVIGNANRLDDAFADYVARMFPRLRYQVPYEYRVVSQDGERLDLQPVLTALGMPDLRGVFVRPGVAGARAEVALGARVIVQFVNADPGRPYVAAFEDAEGDSFVPTRLDVLAERVDLAPGVGESGLTGAQVIAQKRYIRYGDPLLISGVVVPASPTLLPSHVATPPVSVVRGGP